MLKRETIFRGKRIDTEEWVYGSLIVPALPYAYNPLILTWNKENPVVFKSIEHEVIPETVGQYSGRKINGKMLFDGDIFTVGNHTKVLRYIDQCMGFAVANKNDLDNPHTMKVLKDSVWSFPSAFWWYEFRDELNIIGNIHDDGL